MAASILLRVLIQAWSFLCMHAFAHEECDSGVGICPGTRTSSFNDDGMALFQGKVGVRPRHLQNRWTSKSAALHLKKEHIWALSADTLADENVNQFDDIADRTMLAVFGDTLQQLSSAQQAELKNTFRSAGRTNHTFLREMMSTACWLDDWQTQGNPNFTIPQRINDMLVSAGILSGSKDLPEEKPTKGLAAAEIISGVAKSDAKAADHLSISDSCGDFAGRWKQESRNDDPKDTPCQVFFADVVQDGCSLSATSDDAWWGKNGIYGIQNVSLKATGNHVEIQLSHCGHLFQGDLSDDGQSIYWNALSENKACTWFRQTDKANSIRRSANVFLVAVLGAIAFFI